MTVFNELTTGNKAVGAGVFTIGAAGKTTLPKVLAQSVTIVPTIRHSENEEDI